MQTETIDRNALKQAVKDAIVEVATERPDLLVRILVEALEDFGLAEAIRRARDTEEASREEVEAILRGEP